MPGEQTGADLCRTLLSPEMTAPGMLVSWVLLVTGREGPVLTSLKTLHMEGQGKTADEETSSYVFYIKI